MSGRKFPSIDVLLRRMTNQRTLVFSLLIVGALLAFEIFNYSTTEFAMSDLLGELKFGGMRWATILALAFCGIDFAGIARLFTPEQGEDEHAEVWYLFGAWLLAATMNAALTWWGVSIAILQHDSLGSAVIARETLLQAVPIFVAVMVWLSRVLIIGTFSVAGDRLFWQTDAPTYARPVSAARSGSTRRTVNQPTRQRPNTQPQSPRRVPSQQPSYSASFSPSPKPRTDESYSPMPMSAKSKRPNNSKSYY